MDKPKSKRTKLPSIQETIANRNPLRRVAVIPVDPYAVPALSPPESPNTGEATTNASTTGAGDAHGQGAAPPPPTTGTRTAGEGSTKKAADDPIVAYGTYLRASQRTGIKIRAALSGRDSYEIVQDAMDEYFERHPANP